MKQYCLNTTAQTVSSVSVFSSTSLKSTPAPTPSNQYLTISTTRHHPHLRHIPPIQLRSLGIVTFSKYRNSIISNSTPVPPLLARYLFRHRCVAQIEIFILAARLRWYQSSGSGLSTASLSQAARCNINPKVAI